MSVINCCEHEFSIADKTKAGSNPLNPIQQYYAIKEARKKSDYVLVIVHGGNEHYQLPSPRMKETYRFFIDAGADVVINHHQHCYCGYELYNGKPIFYGLGNFCFDRNRGDSNKWNEGFLLELYCTKSDVLFKIIPYNQCSDSPRISIMEGDKSMSFYRRMDEINIIIQNDLLLESEYDQLLFKSSNLRSIFSPYTNRYLSLLCNKKILPTLFGKKKRRLLLAYIQCESHLPKVLNYLRG